MPSDKPFRKGQKHWSKSRKFMPWRSKLAFELRTLSRDFKGRQGDALLLSEWLPRSRHEPTWVCASTHHVNSHVPSAADDCVYSTWITRKTASSACLYRVRMLTKSTRNAPRRRMSPVWRCEVKKTGARTVLGSIPHLMITIIPPRPQRRPDQETSSSARKYESHDDHASICT